MVNVNTDLGLDLDGGDLDPGDRERLTAAPAELLAEALEMLRDAELDVAACEALLPSVQRGAALDIARENVAAHVARVAVLRWAGAALAAGDR